MRSFVVRFYTKHDIDLLPLYYRNVNVPDTIHQVLVAFVEGEELILSLPNPTEEDFLPKSGVKVEYKVSLNENDPTDKKIIEMLEKINDGARTNFLKTLLRLYLWRPVAENFLNNEEDYQFFADKIHPFIKDKPKMMLRIRKRKARKKTISTVIPSPDMVRSYAPPEEKEDIVDLTSEAILNKRPQNVMEPEPAVKPEKSQDEKQDIFYLDEPENEVYKTDNTGLEEDTDDITDAFTSFIDG